MGEQCQWAPGSRQVHSPVCTQELGPEKSHPLRKLGRYRSPDKEFPQLVKFDHLTRDRGRALEAQADNRHVGRRNARDSAGRSEGSGTL